MTSIVPKVKYQFLENWITSGENGNEYMIADRQMASKILALMTEELLNGNAEKVHK